MISNKRHLVHGTALAVISKVISAMLAFIIGGIITRMLDIEDAGKYFYCFSIIMLSSVLGRFGVEKTATRFIAESLSQKQSGLAWRIFTISFMIIAIQAAFAALVCVFIVKSSRFEFTHVELLLIAFCTYFVCFQYFYAEGMRGFFDYIFPIIFGGLCYNTTMVVLLLTSAIFGMLTDFQTVAAIMLCSYFFNAALGFVKGRSRYFSNKGNNRISNKQEIKKILSVSSLIGVKSIFAILLTSGDMLYLGYIESPSIVAIYGSVSRVMVLIGFILVAINIVVSPMIAKKNISGNLKSMEPFLRAGTTLAFIIALVVACIFIFWGDSFLALVYGSNYTNGHILLVILSLGKLATVFTGSCGPVLLMTGHHRYSMYSVAICSMLAFIFVHPAYQYLGYVGVALNFSLFLTIQQFSLFLKTKLSLQMNTGPSIRSLKKLFQVMRYDYKL